MPDSARAAVEQVIGQSLPNVRLHTSDEAASIASTLGARALATLAP